MYERNYFGPRTETPVSFQPKSAAAGAQSSGGGR
jgi:hypothetical protein